jgi:hypothetical protein
MAGRLSPITGNKMIAFPRAIIITVLLPDEDRQRRGTGQNSGTLKLMLHIIFSLDDRELLQRLPR